jgi:hypothetical protein
MTHDKKIIPLWWDHAIMWHCLCWRSCLKNVSPLVANAELLQNLVFIANRADPRAKQHPARQKNLKMDRRKRHSAEYKKLLIMIHSTMNRLEISKRHFVQTHVAVNSGISNSFGLLPLNVLPSLICSPHDRICLVDSPTQPHCCGILWIALCE